MLHVIKECPRHYFLAYIVYRDWPLLPRFNQLLQRFSEGGFAKLWYEKTVEAFLMESYIQRQVTQNDDRKPFSLNDIQAPFYLLVFGYIISGIVFLLEKFVLHPKNLKKILKFINPTRNYMKDFKMHRIRTMRRKGRKQLMFKKIQS